MTGNGRRPRVFYLVRGYPSLSETYIKTELAAITRDHDVKVVTQRVAPAMHRNHLPYVVESDPDAVCELVEEFRPDVVHLHWLLDVGTAAHVARKTGVPYTVRTHGFDVLWGGWRNRLFLWPGPTKRLAPLRYRQNADLLRDDACIGVIGFPFARRRLAKLGVPEHKIRDSYPVADIPRFLDRSPNGDGVMHCGPAMAKKSMGDFLTVAQMAGSGDFTIYPVHNDGALTELNEKMGRPVTIVDNVDHDEMPAEYKKHRWMVKTLDRSATGVGWPVAVAEAQASGVGVCMGRLRPDLEQYVGKAGFLVESLAEARDVVSKPFPDELRELGFELAQRSDVNAHISVLTDLWQPVLRTEA
jgi:hypothetical protein